MRRPLHAIAGVRIHATDGDIGHVHDVYFDDTEWRVRYLHVDTRFWLPGRHVLLAPTVVRSIDWDRGRIHVDITRAHVQESPDIDSHKPVSRQHGVPLSEYFQWPLPAPDALWDGEELARKLHGLLTEMRVPGAMAPPSTQTTGDRNLWSARTVRHHYSVQERDRFIGRVEDFLSDPDAWTVRYLAVTSGGRVHVTGALVPVNAIHWISWDAKRVDIGLRGEASGGTA